MTQPAAPKRRGFRLFNNISEIVNELKKVVWLTRREITYLTGLVLVVTIIAGIILGSLDFGFSELISRLFMGK
jgi:preprotein translocase SecE subunit